MNFFCHAPPKGDPGKEDNAARLLRPLYDDHDLADIPAFEPTHFPYGEEIHAAVMSRRPNVVSFHFGLPEARFVEALKADGAVILCSATTPAEARDLEARGVDAVIAQGWEAGGHQGFYLTPQPSQMGTMALVPQLVDAVSVPVIAAGGIADGRGIAAALALGAAGVQIGTAFLTTEETGISPPHQRALIESDGAATAMTRAFSGRPARGVRNRYMQAMAAHEDALPDFPLMNTVTGPLRKASADADSPDMIALWSGQAVGLNRTGTVAELVDRLVRETRNVLDRLP
jgi:nitronate monooxygenase